MPTTLYRDAQALLIDHLSAALTAEGTTVRVVGQVPNPRPATFVLIRRLGGTEANFVTDAPAFTVEAYAPDEGAAMDLAQLARGVLHDAATQRIDGTQVYRVEETAGPAPLPDPQSETPRVTLTLQVLIRGDHPAA